MTIGRSLAIVLTVSLFTVSGSAENADLTSLTLEQLSNLQVHTATLRHQPVSDAPGNVTIVTAADIRRFGYRTLAEVLANTRSFFVVSDGPFFYTGVRGFSLLGDYNTRFLVMINGHRMTDNVYGAMYMFGQDFPLDMDLVEQIEIVRGPSSSLYGSNGVFAVINVITGKPAMMPTMRVSSETGSFGDQKLIASSSFHLGRGVNMLVSGSGLHKSGATLPFDIHSNSPAGRRIDGVGREAGYHTAAILSSRNWDVTAIFSQHKSKITTGWFQTTLGDRGTTDLETRSFVDATWHRSFGNTQSIQWRGSYDQHQYDGVYDYAAEGYTQFDGALGDWVSTQFVHTKISNRFGTLTTGIDAGADLRNTQYTVDTKEGANGWIREQLNDIRRRRAWYGLFAQHEFKLSPSWSTYIGLRFDDTSADPRFLSPKLALLHKHGSATNKLMYGRAFRNPSTYERFWEPSPALAGERIHTVEFSREQAINKRVTLLTSIYHYRLGGLIQGVQVAPSRLQYQNRSHARSTGIEVEASGDVTDWLHAAGSVAVQRTRGVEADGILHNSPVLLSQFRMTTPLMRNRLLMGTAVRRVSSRLTAFHSRLPQVTLADLTVSAPRIHPALGIQFGVRNLFDTAYSDPLSPEHATETIPRTGRSLFVKLTWECE